MKIFSSNFIQAVLLFIVIPISSYYSQEISREYFPIHYINFFNYKSIPLQYPADFINYFSFSKPASQMDYVKIDSIIFRSTEDSKRKFTFTYNDSGRIVSFVLWDLFNNTWENSLRIINVFDSVGNIISTLREGWNGSSWNNDIKENFAYDSIGNNVSHLIQYWMGDKWENVLKISNTFDSNGNIIISIEEDWSVNRWVNTNKTVDSYTKNGLRDSTFFYNWGINSWENVLLGTFRYETDGSLNAILTKHWNGNSWDNYGLVKITYDENQPQVVGTFLLWDNNRWMNYDKYSYSFDKENNFTYGICESWENDGWIPEDGSINITTPDGLELHLLTHEAFAYYNTTTDVKKENNSNPNEFVLSQNYPNPFNPSTKIKYTIPSVERFAESLNSNRERINNSLYIVTLKVYNILGKEIATLVDEEEPAGVYEAEFNGTELPSGVYFYKLVIGDYSETKKMLLLK